MIGDRPVRDVPTIANPIALPALLESAAALVIRSQLRLRPRLRPQ